MRLGGWCLSRVANLGDVDTVKEGQQRVSLSFLGVRDTGRLDPGGAFAADGVGAAVPHSVIHDVPAALTELRRLGTVRRNVEVVAQDELPILGGLPAELQVALADIAGVAREGLLALSVAAGLSVMQAMFEPEVTSVAHRAACAGASPD